LSENHLTCTFALLDVVTLLHSDLTGADFVHTDTDKAHQANIRVICLNEDDGSVEIVSKGLELYSDL